MRKAQFGLTTLIIFIAMIVTAAVAAGVIIYTTQQLQQTALQTGAQAQQRVSTGLEVDRVFGIQYNVNTGNLDNNLQAISAIAPVVRLMAGSPPINLQQVEFLLTTETGNVIMYSSVQNYPAAIYALLEGGNYLVLGFAYGGKVTVTNVTMSGGVCNMINNYIGQYVQSQAFYNNATNTTECYIALNTSALSTPIPLSSLLTILQEMQSAGINQTYAFVGLAVRNPSVYIQAGDLYQIILYLGSNYLYPEDAYELQIIPPNGYITTVSGRVPTALTAPVVDIWASS